MNKNELRKKYLAIRKNLSNHYLEQENISIAKNLLNHILNYDKKNIISIYHSINNEVELSTIAERLIDENYILALPVVDNELNFCKFLPNENLSRGKFGISEPYNKEYLIPDILIVPSVVCDLFGNRIGYGKGFYDKKIQSLRKTKNITTISPCFDFQIIEKILNETHDQKIDIIIDSKRIIYT